VLAGIVTPAMHHAHPIALRARETWVGCLPGSRIRHRWFLPLHAAAFRTFDTSEYDLIISISHAFEKSVRARKRDAVHLSYCLTPPRYLWDLNRAYSALSTLPQRALLRAARPVLRALDLAAARGVDRFVSISNVVADRVRRAYQRPSAVVYPPVSPKPVRLMPRAREDFLLVIGRLVPYKRVDLAIGAAERLGIRLLVAGDGPERRNLEALSGQHCEFLGEIPEHEAGDLLERCAAFVFCGEEDFGIAPLEANAHGAPVVAFGRGAAPETLQTDRTAVLFFDQTVDAVTAAIKRCLSMDWNRDVIRQNARRFSPERFQEGMLREISAVLAAGL